MAPSSPTTSSVDAADDADADLQAGIEQIARDFEASLQEDAALGSEERAAISAQFRAILKEQAAAPVSPELPDRREWLSTVEALRKSGALDENEATSLVRQLDEALKPLEQRETKLALEFSRRLQDDGEASALAWLSEQQAQQVDGAASSKPNTPAPPSLRGDVVKSRSRRLRGPPKG